jgi:hypothetical protein
MDSAIGRLQAANPGSSQTGVLMQQKRGTEHTDEAARSERIHCQERFLA